MDSISDAMTPSRTVSEVLDLMNGKEHLCEYCAFECESEDPCVYGDIIKHLGRLERIEGKGDVQEATA